MTLRWKAGRQKMPGPRTEDDCSAGKTEKESDAFGREQTQMFQAGRCEQQSADDMHSLCAACGCDDADATPTRRDADAFSMRCRCNENATTGRCDDDTLTR